MGYLKQYFTPRILLHELNDKFLNFEPLHIRVERILSLGRKHQSKFTFFVTAEHIKQNNAQILHRMAMKLVLTLSSISTFLK